MAHAFLDGNKRVALATALAFLRMNGSEAEPTNDEVADLTLAVASGEIRDVADVAARLRELFPDIA